MYVFPSNKTSLIIPRRRAVKLKILWFIKQGNMFYVKRKTGWIFPPIFLYNTIITEATIFGVEVNTTMAIYHLIFADEIDDFSKTEL